MDEVLVGRTNGREPTPHLLINRLCEGETSDSDGSASATLGFRAALPPLPAGRHEVSAWCCKVFRKNAGTSAGMLAGMHGGCSKSVANSPAADSLAIC